MTHLTQPLSQKRKLSLRFLTLALICSAVFALHATPAKAQWTTPDSSGNINSTNSGNVGIGTTTPAAKLHINAGGESLYWGGAPLAILQLRAVTTWWAEV